MCKVTLTARWASRSRRAADVPQQAAKPHRHPCLAITVASLFIICVAAPSISAEPETRAEPVANEVNESLARLQLKPRTAESISETAQRARNAIKHSDFANARQITAAVLAVSRLEHWRYGPFQDFIVNVSDVNDPTFEDRLNAWVEQDKTDVISLILRAQFRYDMGWFKRGHEFGADTSALQMDEFGKYMAKALADADAVIKADDSNPYAFYLKLQILRGFGLTEGLDRAFHEAIAKHPAYYPLYDVVLGATQPKWGGTPEAMRIFVDKYAGAAPEDSPLKLLYLSLYRYLLSTASISCKGFQTSAHADCVKLYMSSSGSADLEQQVKAALHLYDKLDKQQLRIALRDILLDMMKTPGGEMYSGAVLELAAASAHSDTTLKTENRGANDYMIDLLVGDSWYQKSFYDNAQIKYKQALKDIESTPFPTDEAKNSALSFIYNRLAYASEKLHQYADMIAYEKAAVILGGITKNEHFICFGYFTLQAYDEAVRSCTEAIDKSDNLTARYWRGRAYGKTEQWEAALRDFEAVANSQHGFRTSAAIQMSVIYDEMKDFQGSLNLLNRYRFLYDEKKQAKSDLAAVYNNRCYAYMELGDLQNALDDCTASLRYGNLPDAYRKQQELVRRLKAPGKDS